MKNLDKINVWLAAVNSINFLHVDYSIKLLLACDVANALKLKCFRAEDDVMQLYSLRGIYAYKLIASVVPLQRHAYDQPINGAK